TRWLRRSRIICACAPRVIERLAPVCSAWQIAATKGLTSMMPTRFAMSRSAWERIFPTRLSWVTRPDSSFTRPLPLPTPLPHRRTEPAARLPADDEQVDHVGQRLPHLVAPVLHDAAEAGVGKHDDEHGDQEADEERLIPHPVLDHRQHRQGAEEEAADEERH